MSYLELLKLALPETIVVITALAVLSIGLVTGRVKSTATVSTAKPTQRANGTSTTAGICSAVAVLGLAIAIGTVLVLPRNATLFGGMLVITPLTSLFKIICIVLAFFTILLTTSEKSLRHQNSSREELLAFLQSQRYRLYSFDLLTGLPAAVSPGVYSDNMIAVPAEKPLPAAATWPWPVSAQGKPTSN